MTRWLRNRLTTIWDVVKPVRPPLLPGDVYLGPEDDQDDLNLHTGHRIRVLDLDKPVVISDRTNYQKMSVPVGYKVKCEECEEQWTWFDRDGEAVRLQRA